MKEQIAVIFDMDGVLVDNSPFHDEAWGLICNKYGKPKSSQEIKSIFGGTNKIFVERLLEITDKKKIEEIAIEKEALYREIFNEHIVAPKGLLELLFDLKKNNVRLAVGTSAPLVNLDFVLDKLDIRGFFEIMVDESQVTKGKPDPEIYLIASQKLGIKPQNCVVIEDSVFGLRAALAAGMKTIGITTTFEAEKLNIADIIINSFTEMNYDTIESLLKSSLRSNHIPSNR